jgi:YidC/Oxa1 family membrane protein insertase
MGLNRLLAGGAAAAAIVLFTAGVRLLLLPLTLRQIRGERDRARLLPQVQEVRTRHRDDPARLSTELSALYRAEGVNPLGGCLPALLQAPFFVVMYRLFLSTKVAGHPNYLLSHGLFGAPLAGHWLAGSVLSGHGLVFVGVYALIAAVAWLSARRLRRLGQPRLMRLLPFGAVVFAAIVPLATGLYLLTTTAWTALENVVLRRDPAADG